MSTIVDSVDSTIAARVRGERTVRRWSLDELAERASVSKAMISKIERAEASPTAALLGRLSAAFGLTLFAPDRLVGCADWSAPWDFVFGKQRGKRKAEGRREAAEQGGGRARLGAFDLGDHRLGDGGAFGQIVKRPAARRAFAPHPGRDG